MCQSGDAVGCLLLWTWTSSFDMFYGKIRFPQLSVLMVKDCKLVLLEVFHQLMFFQRLLDLVVSSQWFLRSSKSLYGNGVCRCSFPFLLFQCIFEVPVDDEQSNKMTRKLFGIILFSLYRLPSKYPSSISSIIFIDMN